MSFKSYRSYKLLFVFLIVFVAALEAEPPPPNGNVAATKLKAVSIEIETQLQAKETTQTVVETKEESDARKVTPLISNGEISIYPPEKISLPATWKTITKNTYKVTTLTFPWKGEERKLEHKELVSSETTKYIKEEAWVKAPEEKGKE